MDQALCGRRSIAGQIDVIPYDESKVNPLSVLSDRVPSSSKAVNKGLRVWVGQLAPPGHIVFVRRIVACLLQLINPRLPS